MNKQEELEMLKALVDLRDAYLKLYGCYPLHYSKGYAEMQAADGVINKWKEFYKGESFSTGKEQPDEF